MMHCACIEGIQSFQVSYLRIWEISLPPTTHAKFHKWTNTVMSITKQPKSNCYKRTFPYEAMSSNYVKSPSISQNLRIRWWPFLGQVDSLPLKSSSAFIDRHKGYHKSCSSKCWAMEKVCIYHLFLYIFLWIITPLHYKMVIC